MVRLSKQISLCTKIDVGGSNYVYYIIYLLPSTLLEFSYDIDGKRHFVNPPPGNRHGEQFLILGGNSPGFRVRCECTVNSQQYMDYLDILVKPYWAPRAASRFLELVRNGHYDGVAFNRVVPKFLTQVSGHSSSYSSS